MSEIFEVFKTVIIVSLIVLILNIGFLTVVYFNAEIIYESDGVVILEQVDTLDKPYRIHIEDDGIIYVASYREKDALSCAKLNEQVEYRVIDTWIGNHIEIIGCQSNVFSP